MAVELRRACGYRKVGGLYLVAPGSGQQCDRLPLILGICPCCGAGIKQSRGWTWISVPHLLGGEDKGRHFGCRDESWCPLCMEPEAIGKAGLLWVGEKFYGTVGAFCREADELGISKRISAVPQGFKLSETWILLAHPKAAVCPVCQGDCFEAVEQKTCEQCEGQGEVAGVFRVFRPTAIEKIVTESQAQDQEAMEKLRLRGITPVVVPDDDPDHQGSAYEALDPLAEEKEN
jgi:hypothetical protein